MIRLSLKSLATLPATVATPSYMPANHKSGILHMGIGAFHRAHQAYFTDKVLEKFGGDWRIIGVSLRSSRVRDEMEQQNYLYTVTEKENGVAKNRVIAAVEKILVAPEDPATVINKIADPSIKIITITVTEKGYYLNSDGSGLDQTNKDILHDRSNPDQPKTLIGYLAAGLKRRMMQGTHPITVISCDNLSENSHKLKSVLFDFISESDDDLKGWIVRNVSFPATMVDRIVPAQTREHQMAMQKDTGYCDEACLLTEPFHQWVIENCFAGPVPPWDKVGASIVEDVSVYEKMKLRMLNASHSMLAYLGYLSGCETIADAMSMPALKALVRRMLTEEMIPTLEVPIDFDIEAYLETIFQRFENRDLPYTTQQVASDGSQKIVQRLIPPLQEQLQKGDSIDLLTLALAAWARYVKGIDETGANYDVVDPRSTELQAFSPLTGTAYCSAILEKVGVFPSELSGNSHFRQKFEQAFTCLERHGAAKTLEIYNQDSQFFQGGTNV